MFSSYYNDDCTYDDTINSRDWEGNRNVAGTSRLSSNMFQTMGTGSFLEEPEMTRLSFGNADEALIREAEMDRLREGEDMSEVDDPTVLGNHDEDRMFSPDVGIETPEQNHILQESKDIVISVHNEHVESSYQGDISPSEKAQSSIASSNRRSLHTTASAGGNSSRFSDNEHAFLPTPQDSPNSTVDYSSREQEASLSRFSHLINLPSSLEGSLQPSIQSKPLTQSKQSRQSGVFGDQKDEHGVKSHQVEEEESRSTPSSSHREGLLATVNPDQRVLDGKDDSDDNDDNDDNDDISPAERDEQSTLERSPTMPISMSLSSSSPSSSSSSKGGKIPMSLMALPTKPTHAYSVNSIKNIIGRNKHLNSRLDAHPLPQDEISMSSPIHPEKPVVEEQQQQQQQEQQEEEHDNGTNSGFNQVVTFDFTEPSAKSSRARLNSRFARYRPSNKPEPEPESVPESVSKVEMIENSIPEQEVVSEQLPTMNAEEEFMHEERYDNNREGEEEEEEEISPNPLRDQPLHSSPHPSEQHSGVFDEHGEIPISVLYPSTEFTPPAYQKEEEEEEEAGGDYGYDAYGQGAFGYEYAHERVDSSVGRSSHIQGHDDGHDDDGQEDTPVELQSTLRTSYHPMSSSPHSPRSFLQQQQPQQQEEREEEFHDFQEEEEEDDDDENDDENVHHNLPYEQDEQDERTLPSPTNHSTERFPLMISREILSPPTTETSSSSSTTTPTVAKPRIARDTIMKGMAQAQSILARASQPVTKRKIESTPSMTVTMTTSSKDDPEDDRDEKNDNPAVYPSSSSSSSSAAATTTAAAATTLPSHTALRYEEVDSLQREAGVMLPPMVTRYLAQEVPVYTESELRRRVLQAETRGKEKGKQLVETILVAMEKLEEENKSLKKQVTVLEEEKQELELYSHKSRQLIEKACSDTRLEVSSQYRQQLLEKDRNYAEQLHTKDIQIQGKEEDLRRMAQRYTQLEQDLSEVQRHAAEVEEQSRSANEQTAQLQTQYTEMQLRLQSANTMLTRAKQVAAEEANQLQHQIDGLHQQVETLQQQMKKERLETERLMEELQEAQLREVHLRSTFTPSTDQYKILQEERDRAMRDYREEMARVDEVQRRLTATQIQLEEAKRQNVMLARKVNKSIMADGRGDVRAMEETIQRQQQEIQQLRDENLEKEEMMKEMMMYIQEQEQRIYQQF